MNILIVGCGDTGSQLANVLDHMAIRYLLWTATPKLLWNFLTLYRYVYGGSSH